MRPVVPCSAIGHFHPPPAEQRSRNHEQDGEAVALVFEVDGRGVTGPNRARRPGFLRLRRRARETRPIPATLRNCNHAVDERDASSTRPIRLNHWQIENQITPYQGCTLWWDDEVESFRKPVAENHAKLLNSPGPILQPKRAGVLIGFPWMVGDGQEPTPGSGRADQRPCFGPNMCEFGRSPGRPVSGP